MASLSYIEYEEALGIYYKTVEKSGGGMAGVRDEGVQGGDRGGVLVLQLRGLHVDPKQDIIQYRHDSGKDRRYGQTGNQEIYRGTGFRRRVSLSHSG